MTPITLENVTKIYVAYFNRAPDHDGLHYWVEKSNLKSLEEVAKSFADQEETKRKYPESMTQEEFINKIYNNMFNRDADEKGLKYWVYELNNNPDVDRAHMIEAIAMGAKDNDLKIINNKTKVGLYASEVLKLNCEFFSVANVTADESTVEAAEKDLEENYTPQTFLLTEEGNNEFTGKYCNDTFNAFEDIDSLNGNDTLTDPSTKDNDTLIVRNRSDIPGSVTIKNIENMKVTALGDITIDMNKMSGIKSFVDKNSSSKITLDNISSTDMAIGFTGEDSNKLEAKYKNDVLNGDNDTLQVNLDKATDVKLKVDNGFEKIILNSVSDSNILNLNAGSSVKEIKVDGDKELTLGDNIIDNVKLNIINPSKISIGDMSNVTLLTAEDNKDGIVAKDIDSITGFAKSTITTKTGENASIILGDGDDNINVISKANSFTSTTIQTNGGDDKVELSNKDSGKVNISTGDGSDTVYLAVSVDENSYLNLGDSDGDIDTIAIAPGQNYTLNAKGVEELNILDASDINNPTILDLSNIKKSLKITDLIESDNKAIKITGLKDGSTFTATKASVGDLNIEFKDEESNFVVDAQKGLSGSLELSNVKKATIKTGSDSNLGNKSITVDKYATDLVINAKGSFGNSNMDIQSNSSESIDEKLENLSITATDDIKFQNITNDYSLKTVSIKTTNSNAKIDGVSISGADTKDIDTITLEAGGDIGSSSAPTINAESIKTIDIKSTNGTAQLGAISVKNSANKDGGIDSMSVTSKGDIKLSTISVDKLNSLTLNSNSGNITTSTLDASVANESSLGYIKANAKNDISIGNIGGTNSFATLNSLEATSKGGEINIGTLNIQNSDNDSHIEYIKVSASKDVTIGALNIDNIGNIDAKSDTASIKLGAITTNSENSTIGDINLNATEDITINAISANSGKSISSIGDINLLSTNGDIIVAGNITVSDKKGLKVAVDAKGFTSGNNMHTITNKDGDLNIVLSNISTANDNNYKGVNLAVGDSATTDTLKLKFDASDITGAIGSSNNSVTFTNLSTNDNATTEILLGSGDNNIALNVKGGSIQIAGKNGNDTIDLSNTETDNLNSLHIDGGEGIDSVKVGHSVNNLTDTSLVNIQNIILTAAGVYDFSSQKDGFTIRGTDNDETITGSKGNDIIIGGKGSDTLTGEAGKDIFKYTNSTESVSNSIDTIKDFTDTEDKIDISAIAPNLTNQTIGFSDTQPANGDDIFNQNDIIAYTDGTDTYLYIDSSNTSDNKYDEGSDMVIKLSGFKATSENFTTTDDIIVA